MALANLPTELLQRIATFCPGDDILRLSSTCRYLRRCCYDIVALQLSFLYHAPEPIIGARPTKQDVVKLVTRDLKRRNSKAETITWARLSTAAAQVEDIGGRLETLLHGYESVALTTYPYPASHIMDEAGNIVGVLSTLTVLGSPQVNDFTTTAALTGLAGVVMDAQFWTNEEPVLNLGFCSQLLFCVTTGLLGTAVLNNMIVLALRVDEHITLRHRGSGTSSVEKMSTWLGHQTFGLLRQCVMIWMIRSSAEARARKDLPDRKRLPFGRLRKSAEGTEIGEIPLPLPQEKTAIGSISPLAAFAASDSWKAWIESSVQATALGMDDGEWYGYSSTGTSCSSLDSRMSNIKFVFNREFTVMGNMKFRAENCVDEIGTFTLDGRVWTDPTAECGQIFFRLERVGLGSWQFFGSMTPLGITGYWGGHETGLGLFWLWKREWMGPEAVI